MPSYVQIANAGNLVGQNVCRLRFEDFGCSAAPEVTAWDTFAMDAVNKELLTGTTANGLRSMVCGANTSEDPTIDGWALDLVQTAGAVGTSGGNRLKGTTAYIQLVHADGPPAAGDSRTFQLAFSVTADAGAGVGGHDPVLGAKYFYVGSSPVVHFEVNTGTEGVPIWTEINLREKDSVIVPALPNTIYPTGPDTVGGDPGLLDPVTRPVGGEAFSAELWTQLP